MIATRIGWVVVISTAVGVAAATSAGLAGCEGGGCNVQQKDFTTSPAESCIQPVLDVCDAMAEWLTLENNCTDPLVIDYSGTDAGLADVTIAPGTKAQVNVAPFESPWNGMGRQVTVTAQLGSTPVVLAYIVVSN